MTLNARIAKALGWTLDEVRSFSLQALREVLRPAHPKLVAEIDRLCSAGRAIVGP